MCMELRNTLSLLIFTNTYFHIIYHTYMCIYLVYTAQCVTFLCGLPMYLLKELKNSIVLQTAAVMRR